MTVEAKSRRTLLAIVLMALAVFATWWLTDGPLPQRHTGESKVAAVAIRDNVIPFQKFGTELFTVTTLGAHYDDLTYITERRWGGRRHRFVEAVERAAATHDAVDIWILAHGNHFVYWLWDLPPAVRHKIRLVYNTGCDNAYQASEWRHLGARTYVGHPGHVSISPIFYVFFARRWVRGWAVADAVRDANRQTARRLRLVGWLTLGAFDGELFVRRTRAVATGDREVTLR